MNTSSEYGFRNPYATTIIYSTVSDSGEPAKFGFWKFYKTTVYLKIGIRNQRKLPVTRDQHRSVNLRLNDFDSEIRAA